MHSFDNGIGLKVKKDNWEQLQKFMQRIPDFDPLGGKPEIDAVMHCENGAAVRYLGKLYQCLTKRELQQVHPRPKDEDIPPYAKPTGSALIREKMRGPEFVETNDELAIGKKVRNVHALHEESLQMERSLDPDRFSIGSDRSSGAASAKVMRGSTKTVGEEAPVRTQTVVKEVHIKSIDDRNLAQLRASREAKDIATNQYPGGLTEGGINLDMMGENNTANGTSSIMTFDHGLRRRAMELLNEYIIRKLAGTPALVQMDHRRERFVAFIDLVHSGDHISESDAAFVIEGMVDEAGVLASACLDSPREYWKVFC